MHGTRLLAEPTFPQPSSYHLPHLHYQITHQSISSPDFNLTIGFFHRRLELNQQTPTGSLRLLIPHYLHHKPTLTNHQTSVFAHAATLHASETHPCHRQQLFSSHLNRNFITTIRPFLQKSPATPNSSFLVFPHHRLKGRCPSSRASNKDPLRLHNGSRTTIQLHICTTITTQASTSE